MARSGVIPAVCRMPKSVKIVDTVGMKDTAVDLNALESTVITISPTIVYLTDNVWPHLTKGSMSTMTWWTCLTHSLMAHRMSLHQALLHLPARVTIYSTMCLILFLGRDLLVVANL